MLFSTFRAVVALKWRERWNDWWQSTSLANSFAPLIFFLRLSSEFIIKGKKTHAPDCMPPLMGNSFSTVSSGKPVYFLFSRRVVNSTFFGSRSVSLLKRFVLQLLWNGYASDQCVWMKERRGPCGKRNPGARKSHSLFFGEKSTTIAHDGAKVQRESDFIRHRNWTQNFKLESRDHMEGPSVTQDFRYKNMI